MADNLSNTSTGNNTNVVDKIFGTVNTGLTGFFAYKTAKETSKNIAKAPIGNAAIIGGVIVLVVAMVFVLRK